MIDLPGQQRQRALGAGSASSSDTVQRGSAQQSPIGAQRYRLEYVRAVADAIVN